MVLRHSHIERRKHDRGGIKNGFTLLELIIYVAMFTTISVVLLDMIFSINFGWMKSRTETEVQQNLRFAMETIGESIRSSESVSAPASGSSGNSLTLVSGSDTVSYFLGGTGNTVLKKQIGANPAEDITTDKVKVTYLNFTTMQNTASSNSAVQATSTQTAITVQYNSDNPQWQYAQTATSTDRIKKQ